MNVHPAFQAFTSTGTLAFQAEHVTGRTRFRQNTFQAEHVTGNTRVSFEPNGRLCMNFSFSCRITESKI
jgi:hypothetical protein